MTGNVHNGLQHGRRGDVRADRLQVGATGLDDLLRPERMHLLVASAAPSDDVHHLRASTAVRNASISSPASSGLGAAVVRRAPWKDRINPESSRSTIKVHASPVAVRDTMTARRRSATAGQR